MSLSGWCEGDVVGLWHMILDLISSLSRRYNLTSQALLWLPYRNVCQHEANILPSDLAWDNHKAAWTNATTITNHPKPNDRSWLLWRPFEVQRCIVKLFRKRTRLLWKQRWRGGRRATSRWWWDNGEILDRFQGNLQGPNFWLDSSSLVFALILLLIHNHRNSSSVAHSYQWAISMGNISISIIIHLLRGSSLHNVHIGQ